jgi:2-polyprenyl-3-methyl-5-hydroxy-6-metoxy-1,4-benzoquinol methylase
MAFIQFKSNNPNFSFILMKNPETGLTLRRYRQGTFFGYYSKNDNNTYNVYFRDGDDELSFKKSQDEQFEHNDYRRYNSPMFIQGVVNDFFRQHTNGELMENDKVGYKNEIIINQFYMFNPKYLELIIKYFKDFNIIYELLNKNNYKINISTETKTFRECVNLIYTISMFYHCIDKDVWIEESEIERYVRILNNIDAPYFLKYVVKYRVIKSNKKFLAVKNDLEKNNHNQLFEIHYGDTGYQRAEFIKEELSNSTNEILDIGCNDMRNYGMSLVKKLSKDNVFYHAVDIDSEVLEKVNKKAENNGYTNLITYNSLDEYLNIESKEPINIIMSEVFEHVTLDEDTQIITNCLDKLNVSKMIITTPDKRFNSNYLFEDDDKRLDEHIFEMTKEEFQNYFNNLMVKYSDKYIYEFKQIGDKVNNISASQAVIIYKK